MIFYHSKLWQDGLLGTIYCYLGRQHYQCHTEAIYVRYQQLQLVVVRTQATVAFVKSQYALESDNSTVVIAHMTLQWLPYL